MGFFFTDAVNQILHKCMFIINLFWFFQESTPWVRTAKCYKLLMFKKVQILRLTSVCQKTVRGFYWRRPYSMLLVNIVIDLDPFVIGLGSFWMTASVVRNDVAMWMVMNMFDHILCVIECTYMYVAQFQLFSYHNLLQLIYS